MNAASLKSKGAIIRFMFWIGAIFMVAAVSVAVVGYAVLPQPLFREVPDMTAKIEAITDIEHLRKMALLMQGQTAVLTTKANELYASALELMITLSAFASIVLWYCAWQLRRSIQGERNSYSPPQEEVRK